MKAIDLSSDTFGYIYIHASSLYCLWPLFQEPEGEKVWQ